MSDALKELLERVEAGDDFLERDIQDAFGGYRESHSSRSTYRAYHGSLDAAKALHEAVLPGWGVTMFGGYGARSYGVSVGKAPTDEQPRRIRVANGECPARTWLVAILKALIAERDQ